MQPTTPPPRSNGGRVATIVAAVLLSLVALGLLSAGAVLLWADGQKDADGYLSTSHEPFTSAGSAVASDTLDVDTGVDRVVLGRGRYGTVRLQATSRSGRPVFVGIAPRGQVDAYLRGSAYSVVTDISTSPFRVETRRVGGAGTPAPPASRRIWAASAQGQGEQTLRWAVRDGSWSVVVMNADGSRGVDALVSAGARVPSLSGLGWASLGLGLLFGAGAVVLIVVSSRGPRTPASPAAAEDARPAVTA
jgi:hypothetical protein